MLSIKVGCSYCGNIQEYNPRKNKISKNPSTKCKACGGHIRFKKPLIHILCNEVRNNFIIFENKLIESPKHWFRIVPLEHERSWRWEIDIDFGDFKIHFQEYMTEEFGPARFGKIYTKEFNSLDHIEIYNNRINYVFKCLKDSLRYYKICQELSQKIKQQLIRIPNLKIENFKPKLISPPNKNLFKMEIEKVIKNMNESIRSLTNTFNRESKKFKNTPPNSLYI